MNRQEIYLGADCNCKNSSSQITVFQLETSTVMVRKLDPCHCDSMKLVRVRKTLSQMNRSEFRDDITGARKSIVKTWNVKHKSRNDLFWRYHRNKRLEELCNSELLKRILVFLFLPNYNVRETPEKEIM